MLSQQLILGSTYRVKFKGVFERHGVCTKAGLSCLHKSNGVFRLEQIASFNDIVMAGIKLYDNFFAPLGITEEDYRSYYSDKPSDGYEPEYVPKLVTTETVENESLTDPESHAVIVKKHNIVTGKEVFVESGKSILKSHVEDAVAFSQHPIYKFVDVQDSEDVVYAPELTIDGFPEIDIRSYKNLHLVFSLGLFDKPEELDPMLLAIRERMAIYGIRPSSIKLYSTGVKFLNKDEYDAVKALRVPAEIVTIPADAQFEDYATRKVVKDGLIKNIVRTDAEAKVDLNTLVSFESLKSKSAVLDNQLFFTDVKYSDMFNVSRTYYEKLLDKTTGETLGWKLMMGTTECPPGTKVMEFKDAPADLPTYLKRYEKKFKNGKFVMIGYNETRDASHHSGVAGKEEDWYYYYLDYVSDGGVITEVYKKASADQINDAKLPLYKRLPDEYIVATNGPYYCVSRFGEHGNVVGSGEYKYENYAAVAALQYDGCKFEFKDRNDQNRKMTLTLADIIDFGIQPQAAVVMSWDATTPTTYQRDLWGKYNGRLFRYSTAVDVVEVESFAGAAKTYFYKPAGTNQYMILDVTTTETFAEAKKTYGQIYTGVSVSIDATINNSKKDQLIGFSGLIMGQNGSICKEVYLCSESAIDRNYYLKYVTTKHDKDNLQVAYDALEQKVCLTAQS